MTLTDRQKSIFQRRFPIGNAGGFISISLMLSALSYGAPARAQMDEIEVYDAEINAPGEFSVALHNNYTPSGRKTADIPGGIVPNHALNGVPEFAYGVTDWWEVGAYVPVYTLTSGGRAEFDSVKLRSLFVVPHAEQRDFFYGVNFELSYNARHWEPTRFSTEIRPIIGVRIGPVDLIANPIIEFGFAGLGSIGITPAERIAYNVSPNWSVGIEHYADYGLLRHLQDSNGQQQLVFGVVGYKSEENEIQFGVGHGFTRASGDVVLKLIIGHTF